MADKEIARELRRDFLHKNRTYHRVNPCLFTLSSGRIPEYQRRASIKCS
jgi:hypothetical protein